MAVVSEGCPLRSSMFLAMPVGLYPSHAQLYYVIENLLITVWHRFHPIMIISVLEGITKLIDLLTSSLFRMGDHLSRI